jgi:hypothetical protein
MRVRCIPNSDADNVTKEIGEWLVINAFDTNWHWKFNPDDYYWYIDIEDENVAMMFKLRFGI